MSPVRQRLLSIIAACLLACAVLLPLLGHKLLTDWDEGIYAEVARDMLGGSWLVPHWNGLPWLEKPPLMLWATALLFRCFGVTEFWARAASAFAGVAIVALLHHQLLRRRGIRTAWTGTLLLLATPGFLHICRVGEMDAVLALGCVLALSGLIRVDQQDSRGWYLFAFGCAFALMTKGAACVVLPLTAGSLAAAGRWPLGRFGRHFVFALLLLLALVLPWHVVMYLRFGRPFVDEYLGFHVIVRATQQIEGHVTPWWYFARVLVASGAPFVLLLPFAWCAALRDRALRAWAVFIAVDLVFFSLVQTRLPHYIASIYPAQAVLVSCWLMDRLRVLRQRPHTRTFWTGAVLTTAAVWAAALLLTAGMRNNLHRAGPTAGGPDHKESLELARSLVRAPLPIAGPLLLWRGGPPASIAGEVFYARRPVQQIQIASVPPGPPRNRYAEQRLALDAVVGRTPRLLLLDNRLLPALPAAFCFTPLRPAKTVTLGTVVRCGTP